MGGEKEAEFGGEGNIVCTSAVLQMGDGRAVGEGLSDRVMKEVGRHDEDLESCDRSEGDWL